MQRLTEEGKSNKMSALMEKHKDNLKKLEEAAVASAKNGWSSANAEIVSTHSIEGEAQRRELEIILKHLKYKDIRMTDPRTDRGNYYPCTVNFEWE
jgi:hypothetical protein